MCIISRSRGIIAIDIIMITVSLIIGSGSIEVISNASISSVAISCSVSIIVSVVSMSSLV